MIYTQQLILRALIEEDLNATYLSWLNDSEVNRFLETRFLPQTIQAIQSYWQLHRDDASNPWFAICLKEDLRHIGNIKLGPINWVHRRADISLFIGDRNCWGKGLGSEAIKGICEWAFHELDLHKLNAGIYSNNIGSRRAFEKSGFCLEGTLCDEVFSNGHRLDIWRMGLPRSVWRNDP